MKQLYLILGIVWTAAIAFFIFALYKYIRYKDKRNQKIKAGESTIKLGNKIYSTLIRIPVINKELVSIRRRLYDNFLLQDEFLKYKAALYYVLSWTVGILLFIFVCFYYSDNKFQIAILSVFCFYLRNVTLDVLIGDDTNLLRGLIEFNEDLIHDYQLSKDVDEALDQAQAESESYLVVKHIENMKNAVDDEEKTEEYMNDCSNEYLKLIALNCSMTRSYGDTPLQYGESSFIENIKYNNKLIGMELFKREKLKYWLRFAGLLCILPLLAFMPYEWWVNTYLPILNTFYKTSWGFIFKIAITITLILFFFIIRKYTNPEAKLISQKKFYWETALLKITPLKKLINFLAPKEGTKKYYKLRNLINKSQVNTKMEWIQIQKIAAWIISFVFFIAMTFAIHSINRNSILYDNTTSFTNMGISAGEQVNMDETENKYIISLNLLTHPDMNTLKQKIESTGKYDDNTVNMLVSGINYKIAEINNEYIKWYEVVVCLILSFFMSQIPIAYLKLKVKTNQFNMHTEVMLYESIVLILMNYDNTTTELILEYMAKFGRIFKPQLDQAIYNLQKGTKKALSEVITDSNASRILQNEESTYNIATQSLDSLGSDNFQSTNEERVLYDLINRVDFKPFKNLIKNLMKAEDIPVKLAFSTLSSYRNEHAKEREEDNNKVISRRINIGSTLSIAAIVIVTAFYIAVPFALVTSNQMNSIQQELPASTN